MTPASTSTSASASTSTSAARRLEPLTPDALRAVLDDALVHENEQTGALAQLTFSGPAAYGPDRPTGPSARSSPTLP